MMRPPARFANVRPKLATAIVGVLLMAFGALAGPPAPAQATPLAASAATTGIVKTADLSQFRPGEIISDAVFYNSNTMSEAQIQAFLNSKVPTCRSGYVCLKDKTDTTRAIGADAMCSAYHGGGVESAARIIFKVAQACGINPQSLIVMLQKEQGLVTDTWPWDSQYKIAMGQGCPDTAACDSRYFGFFNQVYGAAWQLKRYANPPGTSKYFTWYAPGKTWNVRYHPNVDCGSSPVYIANQATAALYYYTPYQPNAAALRAGYGEGDGCSAYGNRNFYQYFTDWFGATSYAVPSEIRAEWERTGGQSGPLGTPQGPPVYVAANGGGYIQQFTGAPVFLANGAARAYALFATDVRNAYLASGGAGGSWGWPVSDHTCGLWNNGCYQSFQTGTAVSTSSTGGHLVPTSMFVAWGAAGGLSGPLGYPVAAALDGGGGWAQQFQNGTLIASASGVGTATTPEIAANWSVSRGFAGYLGAPEGAAVSSAANGGGVVQDFRGGTVYASPSGVYGLTSQFRANYRALGGPEGSAGWPAGAASCGSGGGCTMPFQHGILVYGPATGSVLVSQAVLDEWNRVGGPASFGYPTAAATAISEAGGGMRYSFQYGTIFESAAGVAIGMTGQYRANYLALGGPAGIAGWPTGVAACGLVGGGCTMPMQNGVLVYGPATGSVLISSRVAEEWARVGGSASFGYPLAQPRAESASGGGNVYTFQLGTVFESSSGTAIGMTGQYRANYLALGGPAGIAGWPTGVATCALVGGGCTMPMQNGVLVYGPSTGSVLLPAAVADAWTVAGGPGAVGYPTAQGRAVDGGVSYPFQRGSILQRPDGSAIVQ